MDENIHSNNFLNIQADLARQKDIYSKQVLHTLNTDERFINYFKDYDETSVQNFKDYYINQRTHWHFNAEGLKEYKDKQNERFYEYAISALKHIQFKKLFHVMASWMNKECNFDDIEVSVDWDKWCKKPFSCPYISPIQLHEVQCYKDFLNQLEDDFSFTNQMYINVSPFNFVEHTSGRARWEGEDKFDQENYYGRWFTFFDQRYGTAFYKLKPGTRVTNEYKYIWHYHQTQRDNAPKVTPPAILPTISIYSDKDEFVNLFEDKDFKELYKAHKRWNDELNFASEVDMQIIYLSEAKEIIPIEYHDDWREGIKIACEHYHRNKTIQILEDVFDEYQILRDMEGGFDEWEEDKYPSFTTREEHISNILNGRRLMGEPEDLNF